MVPDLFYFRNGSEILLPFTVGQNGVSLGNSGMLLPTNLAENIRCCKRFKHSIATTGKFSNGDRSTIDYVSVLTRPAQKSQLGNYTVEDQSFTELYRPGNDNVIRLIDCSSIQDNTTLYLDLSRAQIKVLESEWNKWIQTISTNLSPLVTIGACDGVSILKTHLYTNFQGQASVDPVQGVTGVQKGMVKQVSSKAIHIPGLQARRVGTAGPVPGTGYFDRVTDRWTSSNQIVPAPVWKVLQMWVLPVAMADTSNIEEQSSQGWSAFYIEPNRIPRSTAGGLGSAGPGQPGNPGTAYDRHLTMSAIDVKGIATDGQNEIIRFLEEAAAQGRGGFLDSIMQLAGPIFGALGVI